MEKSVLHKAAEKRIVSISINTLMLLSIVGVFCTIKSENKFTQPRKQNRLYEPSYFVYNHSDIFDRNYPSSNY